MGFQFLLEALQESLCELGTDWGRVDFDINSLEKYLCDGLLHFELRQTV